MSYTVWTTDYPLQSVMLTKDKLTLIINQMKNIKLHFHWKGQFHAV